jgi:hypothetical protein
MNKWRLSASRSWSGRFLEGQFLLLLPGIERSLLTDRAEPPTGFADGYRRPGHNTDAACRRDGALAHTHTHLKKIRLADRSTRTSAPCVCLTVQLLAETATLFYLAIVCLLSLQNFAVRLTAVCRTIHLWATRRTLPVDSLLIVLSAIIHPTCVVVESKVWFCSRSTAGVAGSKSFEGTYDRLLFLLCVV